MGNVLLVFIHLFNKNRSFRVLQNIYAIRRQIASKDIGKIIECISSFLESSKVKMNSEIRNQIMPYWQHYFTQSIRQVTDLVK